MFIVAGQPLHEIPADLFIPPDALLVLLDSFSGPLDLLLYLIRQNNIDILNIPMSSITSQYLKYIELLEAHRMALAADYLVMAALLLEIKSKLLLPQTSFGPGDIEEDPRMELVRRLETYEQFKKASLLLDDLPRLERDFFELSLYQGELPESISIVPTVFMSELLDAMKNLMQNQSLMIHHQVLREALTVRERMGDILSILQGKKMVNFSHLLRHKEGRMGLVVTFLAMLELARQSLLVLSQTEFQGPIHVWIHQDG
jgi:segregation and condensation protein A